MALYFSQARNRAIQSCWIIQQNSYENPTRVALRRRCERRLQFIFQVARSNRRGIPTVRFKHCSLAGASSVCMFYVSLSIHALMIPLRLRIGC